MNPYIGEIRMMGFGFAPVPDGWALCDGSVLQISTNQALFALLGSKYGGNGTTTFALPDLRGRVPVHMGGQLSYQIATKGGVESVTIDSNTMPMHTHTMGAQTAAGDVAGPLNHILAGAPNNIYGAAASMIAINPASVVATGGGLPHSNMQPFAVTNFCIAVKGIFPPRN